MSTYGIFTPMVFAVLQFNETVYQVEVGWSCWCLWRSVKDKMFKVSVRLHTPYRPEDRLETGSTPTGLVHVCVSFLVTGIYFSIHLSKGVKSFSINSFSHSDSIFPFKKKVPVILNITKQSKSTERWRCQTDDRMLRVWQFIKDDANKILSQFCHLFSEEFFSDRPQCAAIHGKEQACIYCWLSARDYRVLE